MSIVQRLRELLWRIPIMHDYRRHECGWGHDLVFWPIRGGMEARAHGWGPKDGGRIYAGDFLLLSNSASKGDTRYRVKSIRYYADPPDMWSAKLEFAPRITFAPGSPRA